MKMQKYKNAVTQCRVAMQDDDEEFVEQEGNVCCVGEVF